MKVCVGYQSALEYWRIHRVLPVNSAHRKRNIVLPTNQPTTKQVMLSGLKLPLNTMLSNPNNRWSSEMVVNHIFSGTMSAGCFIEVESEIEDGLEISSPEFCFLQMAGTLSLPGLIQLGYELCGRYSLPIAVDLNPPDRGFYNRLPLTSIKKLSAFIASMSGFKGSKKAVRALRYVLEGSASPMETKISMLLTLPYQLGGFGFPKPELNVRIIPRKSDRKTTNKEFYVCDLSWTDKNIAVEYDSNQFHAGSSQIAEDSKRRNSLKMMGINVITVTTQQIYNDSDFERVARVIAKCLGKRLSYKNPGFAVAHRDLRSVLNVESGWAQ